MKRITVVGCHPSLYKLLGRLTADKKAPWMIHVLRPDTLEIILDSDELEKENYLITNIDDHGFDLTPYGGFSVITVGFNKKASVTLSSALDDELVFCIQREIKIYGKTYEPQELVTKDPIFLGESAINSLFAFTLSLFFKKELDLYEVF